MGESEMATALVVPENESAGPKQNWIISGSGDLLLIILAPVLWTIWTAVVQSRWNAATVYTIFLGFNVAHHVPTFLRIYGDRDLLRRFRYSLLLGPVIPFCLAMAGVAWTIANDYPLNNIFFLLIILNLWDPWHFLMQHYGFMRIYDRHNMAPRKLSSRMDLAVSATWFAHIMIAAANWLPDLLYTLYNYHSLPFAQWLASGRYQWLEAASLWIAIAVSVIYLGYIVWNHLSILDARPYPRQFRKQILLWRSLLKLRRI